MRSWLSEHSIEVKLFLSIWAVYALYATPAGGAQPNRYVDLVHSVVNEGRFEIDAYHENTSDKVYFNGHYYAAALPGPSFAAVPIYVAFRELYKFLPQSVIAQAGALESFKKSKITGTSFYRDVDNVEFFLSQFVLVLFFIAGLSALGATVLYMFARHLGAEPIVSILMALTYAWGTHAFFFSTTFFEQIVTASLGIISLYVLYLLIERQDCGWRPLVAVGALSGLLMLSEFAGAGLVFLFFLYLFYHIRHPRAFAFVVGAGVPALALLSYNYVLFGNPLDSPYLHLSSEFDYQIREGFVGISYPRLERAVGVLFGPEKGLFVYSPILIFGLLCIVTNLYKKKNSAVAWLCGLVFALFLTYNASFCCWNVTSFGPKYMIAAVPFLVLPMALGKWSWVGLKIFAVGLCVSVIINWTGAQFGFADSVWDHILNVFRQGPMLPVFGAILSHSREQNSLYRFLLNYHGIITLILTAGFGAPVFFVLRGLWKPV